MMSGDSPLRLKELLHDDDRPWAAYAACRNVDSGLFFPGPEGDPTPALRVCAGCAVAPECLEWALETRQRFGVWGGATERDRRRLLRRSA